MAQEAEHRTEVNNKKVGKPEVNNLRKADVDENSQEKQDEIVDFAGVADNEEGNSDDKGNTEGQQNEEDKFESLSLENTELKEKILRMAAENQNTRKRLVKQQQESFKYRHQDILRDIADVIDNFERAIESSEDSQDFHNLHEGVMMIEKQFSSMLAEKYDMARFGREGEPFNPAEHEAVMLEESEHVDSKVVKQVFQTGYKLHERVLRPAKVVVVKPSGPKIQEDNE